MAPRGRLWEYTGTQLQITIPEKLSYDTEDGDKASKDDDLSDDEDGTSLPTPNLKQCQVTNRAPMYYAITLIPEFVNQFISVKQIGTTTMEIIFSYDSNPVRVNLRPPRVHEGTTTDYYNLSWRELYQSLKLLVAIPEEFNIENWAGTNGRQVFDVYHGEHPHLSRTKPDTKVILYFPARHVSEWTTPMERELFLKSCLSYDNLVMGAHDSSSDEDDEDYEPPEDDNDDASPVENDSDGMEDRSDDELEEEDNPNDDPHIKSEPEDPSDYGTDHQTEGIESEEDSDPEEDMDHEYTLVDEEEEENLEVEAHVPRLAGLKTMTITFEFH